MRNFRFPVFLALASGLTPAAHAQTSYPTIQPVSDADRLAGVMRRLATAPNDVWALAEAGELSVKLDDLSGAASLFARADKIDPRNGRVKAGMGAILVRAERPAEALRYFQQAESLGYAPVRFAADRGLAYDLVGEQDRAQRDYRLVLRSAQDDETVRRYALSLGISGQRELALQQLDPLTRRQDRGAWRARAFILAMNGDVPGASRIATTMMSAGMASGLQPFFQRLPDLSAVDRAFAVHFGEVRATPERIADARLKPYLPPLGPDPYAPVQVVARTAPPAQVAAAETGRDRRRRDRGPNSSRVAGERPAPASAEPAVVRPRPGQGVALAQAIRPSTPQPGYAAAPTRPFALPLSAQPAARLVAPTAALAANSSASASATQSSNARPPVPIASTAGASTPASVARTAAPVGSTSFTPQATASTLSSAPGSSAPSLEVAAAAPRLGLDAGTSAQPGISAAIPAAQLAPAAPAAAAPGFVSAPAVEPVATAAVEPPAATPVTRNEDSILARIVASITIPASELGVAAPPRRAPAPAAVTPSSTRVLAAAQAQAERESADRAAAAKTIAARTRAGSAKSVAPAEPRAGRRGAKTGLASAEDANTTARRSKADPAADAEPIARRGKSDGADEVPAKTRAGRRGRTELASAEDADAKTAARTRTASKEKTDEDDRAAARGRRGAKAEDSKAGPSKAGKGDPERIWVQVAGGANDGDLRKAWTSAQKKAAVLKGREGYTTPLRATNRVVTGPFKTEAEARAFVNRLAKQGVSAFQFTSASGQKMTKLPAK